MTMLGMLLIGLLLPAWPTAGGTTGAEPDESGLIRVWYGPVQRFGRPGRAQRWVNVLGSMSRPEEVVGATFSLNGEGPRPLSLGGDRHRLARPGDFNVELGWDELRPGANELVLIADRSDGPSASTRVVLEVEPEQAWPMPYRVDFSRVESLQDVVQVVDGLWRLDGDGVCTEEPYYDRVLALGDSSWTDYEATARLTVHAFTPPEPGPPTYDVTHFGVALRWGGHHRDGRQPSRKWYPLGSQGEFLLKDDPGDCRWRILFDGSGKPPAYADGRNPIALGRPIRVKAQVATLPDGRSRYRFKQWPDDAPEPPSWDVEGLEADDEPSGALCLVPHNSDVTIHEVAVEPLVKSAPSDQTTVWPEARGPQPYDPEPTGSTRAGTTPTTSLGRPNHVSSGSRSDRKSLAEPS